MRTALTLVSAVVALVTVGACGGDGTSSSLISPGSGGVGADAVATEAQSDYLSQANAICSRFSTDVRAMGRAPGNPALATADQLGAWADYLAKVNPVLAAEIQKLAALPAPDAGDDQAIAALSTLTATINDSGAAESAARSADLEGFQTAMATLGTDTATARHAAAAAGLSACAAG